MQRSRVGTNRRDSFGATVFVEFRNRLYGSGFGVRLVSLRNQGLQVRVLPGVLLSAGDFSGQVMLAGDAVSTSDKLVGRQRQIRIQSTSKHGPPFCAGAHNARARLQLWEFCLPLSLGSAGHRRFHLEQARAGHDCCVLFPVIGIE